MDTVWKEFEASYLSKLKPKTRADYQKLYARYLSPHPGGRALADVSKADVASLHRKLEDKPRTSNLVLAVLSKFMSWAEAHDLRPQYSNPVKWVKKYRENRRDRFLTEEELKALGRSLDQELEDNGNIYVVAAIRLVILTRARVSEILTLKWNYVDQENNLLLLPDSKTGRKAILLNSAAAELLHSLPRMVNNPYFICGAAKANDEARNTGTPIRVLEGTIRTPREASQRWDITKFPAFMVVLRGHHPEAARIGTGDSIRVIESSLCHNIDSTLKMFFLMLLLKAAHWRAT